MKMLAIGGELPRQKDFWDINELLSSYSLSDMIFWGLERNPYSLSIEDILRGFNSIDIIPESPEGIECYRGNYWELIKLDLKEEFKKLNIR